MGASGSKIEEDKALQLCHERKKYVRQALDGRCLLAATHVAYIESLKSSGTALRKFVELEAPVESSLYTSTNATPEPLALTEKSLSQFSYPSPYFSQRVDATETFSPSPSPPSSSHFHVNHMRFGFTSSRKVEEKAPILDIRLATTSSTPQDTTSRSSEKPESPSFEASLPSGTPEWDFFGLWHPIDHQFLFQEGKELNHGSETADHFRQPREEEVEEGTSLHEREETQFSEDEFDDDPPADTLVRSFENLNRLNIPSAGTPIRSFENLNGVNHHKVSNAPSTIPSAGTPIQSFENFNGVNDHKLSNAPSTIPSAGTPIRSFEKFNGVNDHKVANASSSIPSAGSIASETDFISRGKSNSPVLSPLHRTPRSASIPTKIKKTPVKEDASGNKVSPKDFLSVMKDIEFLFVKASDSGKEVPRMLEANKFHFRPIFHGKEGGLMASTFFKACFSCGDNPSQVIEGKSPQSGVKYLTWHRTTSSRSSSSGNPMGLKDDVEDLNNNLFNDTCMISGSHASTLDRLFAWERKLYDEVKASERVRSEYDLKCKLLRQLESRAEIPGKIDKTRAVVKDLHSRIRIAILRIQSISQRIEDLRDNELQPQLEELIEGLSRMWEVMSECHRRQFQIMTVAYKNVTMRISVLSESHGRITMDLEHELSLLCSSFTKWVAALKAYLKAVNSWLWKCVSFTQLKISFPQLKKSKRKDFEAQVLRAYGPPIYVTCGSWSDKLDALEPSIKQVSDSIKSLAADTSGFLPHREKNEGKNDNHPYAAATSRDDAMNESTSASHKYDEVSDSAYNMFRNDALKDSFGTSLFFFLGQLRTFSEASVKMYKELDNEIRNAKRRYEMAVRGAQEADNKENNVESNDQNNDGSRNQSGDGSNDQPKQQV